MKKSVWISMIVAGALILAGLSCIAVGHAMGGHAAIVAGNQALVTTTLTPEGDFDSVRVDAINADVTLLYAEDGVCRVEAKDVSDITYTAEVKDGTLRVCAEDQRKWYNYIGFIGGGGTSLTVYLPAKSYESLTVDVTTGDVTVEREFTFSGDVSVTASTGDITFLATVQGDTALSASTGHILAEGACRDLTVSVTTGGVTLRKLEAKAVNVSATTGRVRVQACAAGSLSISTGTGDVTVETLSTEGEVRVSTTSGDQTLFGVRCGELVLHAGTGDVTLTDSAAMGHAEVETNTGDVTFTRSDADTLSVRTTTGSVKGSLLTPKIIYTDTTSGSVDVPKSTEGGLCEIKTTSGSIHITVAED